LTRTCIIFNPAAKGEKARRFVAQVRDLAGEAVLKPTRTPGEGRALARQAVLEGQEIIVAAGGDGTINEVVNGLADAPDGFARARLGVVPLGTANVFARELDLPFRLPDAWAVIREGKEARLDLVQADFEQNGKPRRHYMVQLGGAGLDARAIELLKAGQKRALGSLAYVIAGLKALREAKAGIVAEDGHRRVQGQLTMLGNGRLYGGSFTLFPHADLKDGKLDVTVFPQADIRTLIRFWLDYLGGRHEGIGGSVQFQCAELTLRACSPSPVPFELDGDNVGYLPARFSVRPRRLRVVC